LGSVELLDGDQAVPIGSRNQRRILAVLLAHVGEVVPVDTLLDAVWRDDQPESALASLRTYVSRLRGVLGEQLATRGSVDRRRRSECTRCSAPDVPTKPSPPPKHW
jgi:DNA-binding SARP family transcriptional activator